MADAAKHKNSVLLDFLCILCKGGTLGKITKTDKKSKILKFAKMIEKPSKCTFWGVCDDSEHDFDIWDSVVVADAANTKSRFSWISFVFCVKGGPLEKSPKPPKNRKFSNFLK